MLSFSVFLPNCRQNEDIADSNEQWQAIETYNNETGQRFDSIEIPLQTKKCNENHLPHWLADEDLKNSETETLPLSEEQFWKDLIDKYLLPIEPSEGEKVKADQLNSIILLLLLL